MADTKPNKNIGDPDMADIWSTKQVAKALHRSSTCIIRWLNDGIFPKYAQPHRVHSKQRGLFWPRAGILKFIEESQEKAASEGE